MEIDAEDLHRLGLYDHDADDAEVRLAYIAQLMAKGATLEMLTRFPTLDALSADFSIRGTGRRYTVAETAEAIDMTDEETMHMCSALGISVDPEATTFTDAEVEMLRFFHDARAMFSDDIVSQILRVTGKAYAQLAEAEVNAIRRAFEVPYRASGADELAVSEGYETVNNMLLPGLAEAHESLHRLLLARASSGTFQVTEEGAALTSHRLVGFADIADFTDSTQASSAPQIGALVDAFEDRVTHHLAASDGRVIKMIGDEVMFVFHDHAVGVASATALARTFSERADLPRIRVGLSGGHLLAQEGDYFGPPVNLAARLVSLAQPDEVVIDAGSLAVARVDPPGPAETVTVKGFTEPVAVHRLR